MEEILIEAVVEGMLLQAFHSRELDEAVAQTALSSLHLHFEHHKDLGQNGVIKPTYATRET